MLTLMQFNGLRNVYSGKLSVLPNTGSKQKKTKNSHRFQNQNPHYVCLQVTKMETVKKEHFPIDSDLLPWVQNILFLIPVSCPSGFYLLKAEINRPAHSRVRKWAFDWALVFQLRLKVVSAALWNICGIDSIIELWDCACVHVCLHVAGTLRKWKKKKIFLKQMIIEKESNCLCESGKKVNEHRDICALMLSQNAWGCG